MAAYIKTLLRNEIVNRFFLFLFNKFPLIENNFVETHQSLFPLIPLKCKSKSFAAEGDQKNKHSMETTTSMVSAFLPSYSTPASLVEALLQISKEVASMEKLHFFQVRNSTTLIRRVKLLYSFFEEIRETNSPLPPSSVLCFRELFATIHKAKLLIQECKTGSCIWNIIQTEAVSHQFYNLVKEMVKALDILPLSLLDITPDVRDQVELLHKQAKRAEAFIDQENLRLGEKILFVNEKKNWVASDSNQLEEMMTGAGLITPSDFQAEIWRLEAEICKQAGTGGLLVVSKINNLISLITFAKFSIFGVCANDVIETTHQESHAVSSPTMANNNSSVIPDEYRCPISLELMRDPVIVSSGHTYDRLSISKWLDSGHNSCPKSGQKLLHMALIPNYALKSLVHQWCQDNGVVSLATSSENKARKSNAVDHIFTTKAAFDSVKMTADFLVGKLATGSSEIQRLAGFELRLLAKSGMDNRRIIAEAGAIPFLVSLLASVDPRAQENAVTALLNLSILDSNKVLIMAAGGAVDSIVRVLEKGHSMEARENAAATIFSLSMIKECKVTIGARPDAIPALVGLLRDGTSAGKRDAATALGNLAIYDRNRASVVAAGAVPLLVDVLMDEKARITDDALALLVLLSGCWEGLKEIREIRMAIAVLVDLLRLGSAKGKENSIAVLWALCKTGGEEMARRLLINPRSVPSLQSLASNASSPKARRKADAVLRFLNRYCSHPPQDYLVQPPQQK